MIGLSNFTGAGKDDKLKFAFMVFDEDGNGVITKQELPPLRYAGLAAAAAAAQNKVNGQSLFIAR